MAMFETVHSTGRADWIGGVLQDPEILWQKNAELKISLKCQDGSTRSILLADKEIAFLTAAMDRLKDPK